MTADLDLPVVERAPGPMRRERARADVVASARVRPGQTSSLLAARAAAEYDYVVKDVRRISLVGGSLILVMLALYVVIEVLHVVSI